MDAASTNKWRKKKGKAEQKGSAITTDKESLIQSIIDENPPCAEQIIEAILNDDDDEAQTLGRSARIMYGKDYPLPEDIPNWVPSILIPTLVVRRL